MIGSLGETFVSFSFFSDVVQSLGFGSFGDVVHAFADWILSEISDPATNSNSF